MVNLQEQNQVANILPSGESMLAQLGLDPTKLKLIKPSYRSHYRAVVNWLTKYHPNPNITNLEKVKGSLEAFDHLCEVEDWDTAKSILMTELHTSNSNEVYWQLGIWGYSREQIQFCQRILGKLDSPSDGIWLNALGLAYRNLGKYEEAINFHQQHLTIAREIGDRRGEGAALGGLGNVYRNLGKYEEALDFHQQQLVIAREIGDRNGEGTALINMGATQFKLKKYSESLINNQVALEIFQEIGDRSGDAEVFKNLAELHHALGEIEVARQYCQQALVLATELRIPLAAECEALL